MSNSGRRTARGTTWLLVLLLQPIALIASDYVAQVTFNGRPVPGVTITARQGERQTAVTTDEDGIYRLADLTEGVWSLTIEMLGFTTVRREITVPRTEEPAPSALTVRSFDELARETAPAEPAGAPGTPGSGTPDAEFSAAFYRTSLTRASIAAPDRTLAGVVAAVPIDATGIGAAEGLLINGSLNNGASTLFAQPRGIGNNRPRLGPRVYTYAAGLQLGNSAWDARPFSFTGSKAAKPSYSEIAANGTFQGPITLPGLPNQITLTLGYQGGSTTTANTRSARMPTDLERAGDFSQTFDALNTSIRLIDPTTGHPFEGNMIPPDRISPQAAALLAYYPHADPEASSRFNYQRPVITTRRQNGLQSNAAYTIDTRTQYRVSGGVSYERSTTDATSLFGFEDTRESSTFSVQAMWARRVWGSTTLTARYAYSRTASESVPYFANRVNVSGDAGILGNDQDPRNWGPVSLTFASDLAELRDGRYASEIARNHLWSADLSKSIGSHTVKVGTEIRMRTDDVFAQQDPRGSFGFTGAATGHDFADFLLGLPHTSAITFGNPDKNFRGESYAAYMTDDWRVGPSLTIDVGLRWEYETPITEARNRLVNLDVSPGFDSVAPVLPGHTGPLTGRQFSDALLRGDTRGLQPRIGMAWRPTLGSSMVIRAGYGVYRNTNVYQSIAALLAGQPPFSTAFNIATSAEHPLTLANGFTAGPNTGLPTFAVDPNFRVSSAHNWQVSMERDLPASLALLAVYLGTRGTGLMQQVAPNTYPAGAESPCPTCPSGFRYLTSNGRSNRHAVQIEVRRRLSAGFTSSLHYTLAEAMDNAGAFGGATLDSSALAQNWLDLEAEYARSNFDQRHLVMASVEYTTGVGVGGGTLIDGWRGRLVKDWTFAATLSSGSGLPRTPVFFSPLGATGITGALRPDLTGVPHDPPDGSYANAASFSVPSPGTFGNAKRNSITGPSTFSLNAGISRTFRLGSRLNADWRISVTNLLNRVTYDSVTTLVTSPQFGLPNSANDMRRIRSSIRLRF